MPPPQNERTEACFPTGLGSNQRYLEGSDKAEKHYPKASKPANNFCLSSKPFETDAVAALLQGRP
jgi:hypothetical protein